MLERKSPEFYPFKSAFDLRAFLLPATNSASLPVLLAILAVTLLMPVQGGPPAGKEPGPRTLYARAAASPRVGTASRAAGKEAPQVLISKRDLAEMRLIPEGEFVMGRSKGYPDERPEHGVLVKAFYIDTYEVTNKQYGQFLKSPAGRGHEPDQPYGDYMPADYFTSGRYNDYPVVNVSWYDAKAYCEWVGKRLPTEYEWEKAARGTDGRIFPWGMEWDEKRCNWDDEGSNYQADGYKFIAPVGSFPAGVSPYGLHDMAGNAWEWVEDWYTGYPGSNRKDPDYGEIYKVLRGGSWLRYPLGVTATARDYSDPALRFNSIGFRCAADADEASVARLLQAE